MKEIESARCLEGLDNKAQENIVKQQIKDYRINSKPLTIEIIRDYFQEAFSKEREEPIFLMSPEQLEAFDKAIKEDFKRQHPQIKFENESTNQDSIKRKK